MSRIRTRSQKFIKVLGTTTAVLLAVGTACSDDSSDEASGLFTNAGGDDPRPENAPAGGQPTTPDSLDEVAQRASEDVEAFWEETFPEVYGGSLQQLQGGWNSYNSSTPPPSCGPYGMTYEEAQFNAFYCPLDDFIAYDDENLFSWVSENFGGFTIAIVLAHEFGHAIQERVAELDDPDSVRIEMQADCFAGAWAGWIEDGNSEHFALERTQLDSVVGGMLAIRDLPGMDPDDPFAHGLGFDRLNSFQDGFDNGAPSCAEYTERHQQGDLAVTQVPFTADELETGGDQPLEDGERPGVYTLSEEFLEIFYNRIFAEQLGSSWEPVQDLVVFDPASDQITCGGETLSGPDELEWFSAYCVDENIAVIDGSTMAPQLWEQIGDFAVAAEIARLWAFAAQSQLDIDDRDQDTSLQADCLTGYWAGALFPDETDATALGPHPEDDTFYPRLSAGDLDEALISLLAYGDARRADAGTVFERSAAMRDGALDGIAGAEGASTCAEYHPFD